MAFSKFEQRCQQNPRSAYAQDNWQYARHHERFKRYVKTHGLLCQACNHGDGEILATHDSGQTLSAPCVWCEGTGRVSRWIRGFWLRYKKQMRKEAGL